MRISQIPAQLKTEAWSFCSLHVFKMISVGLWIDFKDAFTLLDSLLIEGERVWFDLTLAGRPPS